MEKQSTALAWSIAQAKTAEPLSLLLGLAADRCQPIGSATTVCSWEVFKRMSGYDVLASLLHTGEVVYAVCVLPSDGSPRAVEPCSFRSVESDQLRL